MKPFQKLASACSSSDMPSSGFNPCQMVLQSPHVGFACGVMLTCLRMEPFKRIAGLMGMTSKGALPHTGEQLASCEELKQIPQGLDSTLVETGGDKALVVRTLGTALPVALEADGSLGHAFFTPGQQAVPRCVRVPCGHQLTLRGAQSGCC